MIARSFLLIVLLLLLPDLYLCWRRYVRRVSVLRQVLWGLPTFLLLLWTIGLACERDFVPRQHIEWLYAYLWVLLLVVVPKWLYCLSAAVGLALRRLFRCHRNYGRLVGLLWAAVSVVMVLWGAFVEPQQLEVKRVELTYEELPDSFDGYRMVLFSDAHVGTLTGRRQAFLQRVVDSINAQRADLVVFAGDLQNVRPEEIEPHLPVLSSIEAKDGTVSVMGNHDYAEYIGGDDESEKYENLMRTAQLQTQAGWQLLLNDHLILRRGSQRMVVAGMENDGEGRFLQRGDLTRALLGIRRTDFIVMVEHDPTSWRRKILPHSHTQLTLSGHTHGGQIRLLGWSPASLRYREYDGLYRMPDHRVLYVTKGVGGVIPFRLGAPAEIIVITLKKQRHS